MEDFHLRMPLRSNQNDIRKKSISAVIYSEIKLPERMEDSNMSIDNNNFVESGIS